MGEGAMLGVRWIIVCCVLFSIWMRGVLFIGHLWVPIPPTMYVAVDDDQVAVLSLQCTPPPRPYQQFACHGGCG